MKKHAPGTIYPKFVGVTAMMMVVALIVMGILMLAVDASMDTIEIVLGVIGALWIIIEGSIIVYGAFDIWRTKRKK